MTALTKSEKALCEKLVAYERCSNVQLKEAAGFTSDDSLKVVLSRLRKKLDGVSILSGYRNGYWVDEVSREKIRELLNAA